MRLSQVKRGKIECAKRVVVYGPEGIGKTTFGASAPAPIFITSESGTNEFDVARITGLEGWHDVREVVGELETQEHEFKTAVIDTLDWLEPMCWDWVCKNVADDKGKKHESIEGFGYGKGYMHAFEQWRLLLAMLDRLRDKKGMHIILLAHAQVKMFKNPAGDDYERYELKLQQRASALVKEWCDAVLFAQYETFTHEKNKRVKGIASGKRLMHTERSAAFDAKNRFNLPAEMPLDWEEFLKQARGGAPKPLNKLHDELDALIPLLSEEDQQRAKKGKEKYAQDARELVKIINWAQGKVPAQETASETAGR